MISRRTAMRAVLTGASAPWLLSSRVIAETNVALDASADDAMRARLVTPHDFKAVGDGQADDTDALVSWLKYMQARNSPGLILGRHKVQRGTLKWIGGTKGHAPGPQIYTGPGAALVAASGGRGPLLAIENLRAGTFIMGGKIETLRFEDHTKDAITDGHGLQLSGVESMEFGPLLGTNLRGDLVHVLNRSIKENSDYFHVGNLRFAGLRADRISGFALNNDLVGQGFSACQIGWIKAMHCGAWRGAGASNICYFVGCGSSPGWAIDWFAWPRHTVSRSRVLGAELDAPAKGINLQGLRRVQFENVRIVHRRKGDGTYTRGNWPTVAVSLGGSGITTHIRLDIEHRIQPDVTAIGTLYNFDNNVSFVEIDALVGDGKRLVSDAMMMTNPPPAPAAIRFRRDGRTIRNTFPS